MEERGRRRKRISSMILEEPARVSVVPETSNNPIQSKTTAEAVAYLKQLIEEAESRTQLIQFVWCPSAFLVFIAASILLIFYIMAPSLDRLLLSSVVLLYISAAVNAAIKQFDAYRNNTEIRRRLGPAKQLLQSIAENTEQAHVNDPVSKSFSTYFQTALRDGQWVQIPNIALVPGDLIQLRDGMIAPCFVESVAINKPKKQKKLYKGDLLKMQNPTVSRAVPSNAPLSFFSLSNNTPAKSETPMKIAGCNQKVVFKVLDCPLTGHLSKLGTNQGPFRPISTYVNQKKAVHRRVHQITVLGFILAIIPVAFLLLGSRSILSMESFIILAHQPIVAILSCLGPSEIFFSFLVDAFGNGVLIQTDSDLKNVKHGESTIGLGPSKLQNLRLFLKERRATFYRIVTEVFGLGTSLTRSMNPFETLGQITAVCALDKDGIVSEVFSAPEHVLIWDNGSPVVLDLITDHDLPNHITFERNWEQHFDSIKPLALSCLMSATCAESSELAADIGRPRAESKSSIPIEMETIMRDQTIPSECLCQIGREVGFAPDFAIRSFNLLKQIHVLASTEAYAYLGSNFVDSIRPQNVPHMACTVVQSYHSEMLQLFSRGDPRVVLSFCDYVWNKQHPLPLAGGFRKKVIEILQHWAHVDFKCFAFAYSPIAPHLKTCFATSSQDPVILTSNVANTVVFSEADPDPEVLETQDSEWDDPRKTPGDCESEQCYQDVLTGQILLGIAAIRPPPKPEMPYLIEDLTKAGIRYAVEKSSISLHNSECLTRFVFFSATGRRKSIAFTSKLGLESDWNFFISLKDRSSDPIPPSEAALNISKLPEGISKIRDHISKVDNVPLLVSLFTDSTAETTKEMISILQENGESVLCIGSSLKEANFPIFLQSDIAVSLEPRIDDDHSRRGRAPAQTESYFSFAKHVNSLPCAFTLSSNTNIRTYLSGMISQARNLLIQSIQAQIFFLACALSIMLLCTLSLVMGLPCVFEAYHVLLLMWFVVPLLSGSLLFSHPNRKIMQIIMEKNVSHLSSANRFTTYYFARFLPSILFCLWIYSYIVSRSITEMPSSLPFSLWKFDPATLIHPDKFAEIYVSKVFTLFTFVYCLVWLCMGSVYRNDSLRHRNPFVNRVWLSVCIFVLLFQFVVLWSSVNLSSHSILLYPSIGLIFWPVCIIAVDELVKHHDRTFFRRHQQRMRILFDTRLGMHSPK